MTLLNEFSALSHFIPGIAITYKEISQIIDQVKVESSALNIQYEKPIIFHEPDIKERIYEKGDKEYGIETSAAVIIVLGKQKMTKREVVIKSGLLAMLFNLCAKDKGWDTYVVSGFNQDVLQEYIQTSDDLVPIVGIAIGRRESPKF
jgi:nitroreductase